MREVLITGNSSLIGPEAVEFFEQRGYQVHGIDNNMRRDFFGPDGDTTWRLEHLRHVTQQFTHYDLDIRDRARMLDVVQAIRPDAIIHCASQPSRDLASKRLFDDFDVNAVGTLNLLEAARQFSPEAAFVHMSTNKVYGDAPNRIALQPSRSRRSLKIRLCRSNTARGARHSSTRDCGDLL